MNKEQRGNLANWGGVAFAVAAGIFVIYIGITEGETFLVFFGAFMAFVMSWMFRTNHTDMVRLREMSRNVLGEEAESEPIPRTPKGNLIRNIGYMICSIFMVAALFAMVLAIADKAHPYMLLAGVLAIAGVAMFFKLPGLIASEAESNAHYKAEQEKLRKKYLQGS